LLSILLITAGLNGPTNGDVPNGMRQLLKTKVILLLLPTADSRVYKDFMNLLISEDLSKEKVWERFLFLT